MEKFEKFKSFKINNLNAVNGGKWEFTGGTKNGHREDMNVNGHEFHSNGDGTYSKRVLAN